MVNARISSGDVHTCTNMDPGFQCMCMNGFHLWDGSDTNKYPLRYGENGEEIWHALAVNVSCVRKY